MICGPIDLTWLIDLGALRRTHRSRGKPFSALDLMAGAVKGLFAENRTKSMRWTD
jgi:hypothetical protein